MINLPYDIYLHFVAISVALSRNCCIFAHAPGNFYNAFSLSAFIVRSYPLIGARTRQRPHQHICIVCKIRVLQDIIALTEDLMGLSSSQKSKAMKEVEEETVAVPVQVNSIHFLSI